MTVKQKQCLLCYLGYYEEDVDGIWGTKSMEATKAFQADYGLEVDGIAGTLTEEKLRAAVAGTAQKVDFWKGVKHFRKEEFACKCGRYCDGYPAEMDKTLIQVADRVRSYFGAPCTVSSGLRCKQHNENVDGVENSRHLTGKAVDFSISGKTAQQVLSYVQQQPEIRYAYAIDSLYVHMDVK